MCCKDGFHRDSHKFVLTLISANLYLQKQRSKKTYFNKQENLINSNKLNCSTVKNKLIPEEPCTLYTISDGVKLIRLKHKYVEFVIMKVKRYKQIK